MSKKQERTLKRRTSIASDINSLWVICGVLFATILLAGVSEANFREVDAKVMKAEQLMTKTKCANKLTERDVSEHAAHAC